MSAQKNVKILLFRYSVVVKGIEKNLTDLGYAVESITDGFDELEGYASHTDLFILYLPGDIMDDRLKLKELETICSRIGKLEKKMLVIGEKKYHFELSEAVPEIDDYGWLDRPIESEALGAAAEAALNGTIRLGAKRRILIVDDDPAYAAMVREWIKDHYKVDIVTAGLQAISFLMKNKVDLVLLDYEMSGVDGPKVLKMLRQEASTKDIHVIFLTGVGTKEEVARVMELRPDGYVLKSTTRDNLLAYIGKKLV
ncbi:MAG: response regulator [Lachnospiraceae bacterium]|nr:response regulator [Lachnospiraceae bacterium]